MKTTIAETKPAKSDRKQIQTLPESTIGLQEYWNEGYHCRLVMRKGNVALFEQCTDCGKLVAYEVILIQSYRGKEFAPQTDSWGSLGWSYSKYENAIRVFESMTEAK